MEITFLDFRKFSDSSGVLVPIENGQIPFDIKRIYYIYRANQESRRGFHAHKQLQQILICLNGSCKLLLDDGVEKSIVELNSPSKGLYLTSLIWREIFDFSEDCVLLVLANHIYDESDYIRDYEHFLEEVKTIQR